jgi:dihydroorotase
MFAPCARLADGTIVHRRDRSRPHPVEAKDCETRRIRHGRFQSAFSVVQATVVGTGMLDWADVAHFSRTPAAIGQLDGR